MCIYTFKYIYIYTYIYRYTYVFRGGTSAMSCSSMHSFAARSADSSNVYILSCSKAPRQKEFAFDLILPFKGDWEGKINPQKGWKGKIKTVGVVGQTKQWKAWEGGRDRYMCIFRGETSAMSCSSIHSLAARSADSSNVYIPPTDICKMVDQIIYLIHSEIFDLNDLVYHLI